MRRRTQIFTERLDELGAEFDDRNERRIVTDFGRPSEEYETVRGNGVGLVDMSQRDVLAIEGEEAVPWLQGLATNDLVELQEPGLGQRTFILDSNGRILAAPSVLHIPNMLLLVGEANTFSDNVESHLKSQIITEDVELHNRSGAVTVLGLYGAESGHLLEQLGDWHDTLQSLGRRDGTWGTIGAVDVVIETSPMTGEQGFLMVFERQKAHHVWNSLLEYSQVSPVGREALENLRLEAGIPRVGEELDDKTIPLEADLERHISFDKGCYLGQEIIVRLRDLGTPARRLRRLVLEGGAAPAEGASVEVDDKKVGDIESAAWSPLRQKPIGLAYIKRKYNDLESKVIVEGREAIIEPIDSLVESP